MTAKLIIFSLVRFTAAEIWSIRTGTGRKGPPSGGLPIGRLRGFDPGAADPDRNIVQGAKKAQWLNPELRVKAQHLKAKGTLRHPSVRALLDG